MERKNIVVNLKEVATAKGYTYETFLIHSGLEEELIEKLWFEEIEFTNVPNGLMVLIVIMDKLGLNSFDEILTYTDLTYDELYNDDTRGENWDYIEDVELGTVGIVNKDIYLNDISHDPEVGPRYVIQYLFDEDEVVLPGEEDEEGEGCPGDENPETPEVPEEPGEDTDGPTDGDENTPSEETEEPVAKIERFSNEAKGITWFDYSENVPGVEGLDWIRISAGQGIGRNITDANGDLKALVAHNPQTMQNIKEDDRFNDDGYGRYFVLAQESGPNGQYANFVVIDFVPSNFFWNHLSIIGTGATQQLAIFR